MQIPEAFMIEMREVQEKEAEARDRIEREVGQRRREEEERRLQKAAEKEERRRRQKYEEEEEKLKRLLSPNDSLHHGKALCFHDTRVAVLATLLSWAMDGSLVIRLFWLFGVAGCGKSTVAATISALLRQKEMLAGTFFCKRDEKERREAGAEDGEHGHRWSGRGTEDALYMTNKSRKLGVEGGDVAEGTKRGTEGQRVAKETGRRAGRASLARVTELLSLLVVRRISLGPEGSRTIL